MAEPQRHDVLIGTSFFGRPDNAFPVYDAYWESGQRRFDTAWIYGYNFDPGCCERTFGSWLSARGLAEQAWVLAKGAHTPECYPDRIAIQLADSGDRMGLRQVSMYMMHRDNPQVPVGEFVCALSALVTSGLALGYGFSNWPLYRVRRAADYAHQNGLVPPSGISNQFSLVEMVRHLFPGVVGANTAAWRTWLADSGVALYPWASQGRGSFARSEPQSLASDPQAAAWNSQDNIARVVRAHELARVKEVSATAISLAWVIAQPFAVHPIIGPRAVAEVADSLAGLEVRLTAQERDWLETGA